MPKGTPIFICRSGGRSLQACEMALAGGRTQAVNLEGGLRAWAAQIDPSLHGGVAKAQGDRRRVTLLWLKALHVVFVVTWFAGLFYLPRLFVYHAGTDDAPGIERF